MLMDLLCPCLCTTHLHNSCRFKAITSAWIELDNAAPTKRINVLFWSVGGQGVCAFYGLFSRVENAGLRVLVVSVLHADSLSHWNTNRLQGLT